MATHFSRMVLLLTRQAMRKIGWSRTRRTSSGRTSGRPTPQILIRSTFTSGERATQMQHRYQQPVPKPQNVAELREVLKTIWNDLPQDSTQKAILAFRKRLKTCIEAEGGHFEHLL